MTIDKTKGKKLVNTWNGRESKGDFYVLYETEKGARKVAHNTKFDWYFGIRESDYNKAKALVKAENLKGLKSKRDPNFPNFVKVIADPIIEGLSSETHKPYSLSRYQLVMLFEDNGISTYEGDLSPDRRWYIDAQMEIAQRYSKLYFDIETDDSYGAIEIGKEKIISFAAIDQDGKKYFTYLQELTDEAEKEMLKKILKLVAKYDIILGWNSREFDIPYLKARMKKYDLNRFQKGEEYLWRWMEIGHFDLLKRFRHIYKYNTNIRSFSLDYISNYFLRKGKVKHDKMRIIDMYNNDKELLKKYNLEDCILVKELDERQGASQTMILQAGWCGVPPSEFGLYTIIDAHILRTAHREGLMEKTALNAIKEKLRKTPSQQAEKKSTENPDESETLKKKYMGGLVLEPEPGYYSHVYTFDFKSLYPTSMKTSNIGPDTLMFEDDNECIINPGTQFIERKAGYIKPTYFKQKHGTIYLAISELMEKRKEYKRVKNEMLEQGRNKGPEWDAAVSNEIIVKELSNSTYGIMGLEYGRYFDVDVAESITLFGQWTLRSAKGYFESQGYKVIYGDTDSVFVATDKDMDVHEELDKYHAYLEDRLKKEFRINESFIELEVDKEYTGFILITKKTYCGHMVDFEGKKVDDIYSKGIEFAKRGNFAFAAKKQKELVDFIFRNEPSTLAMKKWLIEVKDEFLDTEFTKEELAISHKVGKNLDEYDKPRKSAKKKKADDTIIPVQEGLFGEGGAVEQKKEKPKKAATLPLHVRIAKKIKEETGEFYRNTEVEYIVTGHDKTIEGVHIDEFDGTWSRDYYWENKTLPLLKRIVEVTHPKIDFGALYNKSVRQTLFSNETTK